MPRKRILLIAAAVAVAGAFFYFNGGHEAPAGQAGLTSLTEANLSDFTAAFDRAKGEIRVLVLLSPT